MSDEPNPQIAAAIKAQAGLSSISPDMLARLCAGAELQTFERDDVLIAQGGDNDYAMLVVSGEVQVAFDSAYGTVVVARMLAPCLIGEIAALASLARTASVRAMGDVTALRIDQALLRATAQETPALTLHVISQLGVRIRNVNSAISLYTHALAALEQRAFDPKILEDLRNPVPELAEFGQTLSRMAEQIILRRQREDEMASAALIQQALLPKPADIAQRADADVWAMMTPAREVGGDFYDFIELDDGRFTVGVGDVCGKGMPAALFMGISKTLLRIHIKAEPDLAVAISKANHALVNENATELFATLFYATFNPRTGALDYCSCGHNPPLLRRADGSVTQLTAGGMPVGVFGNLRVKLQHETLSPGDLLLLYTDGVTEAFGPGNEEFGEARLSAVLSVPNRKKTRRQKIELKTAQDWSQEIAQAVTTFAAGTPQSDDITCLTLIAR